MKKRLPTMIRMKLSLMQTMARMMPSCKDVSELVSRSLDENLSFRERMGVRMHLVVYKWCRRYHDQLHLIREAITWVEQEPRPDDPLISLSVEARARINKSLQKQN